MDKETFLENNKKYTGFIWMISDKYEPKIINLEAKEINLSELYDERPYNKIQEAYLFDGENSIHIKNIDGKELIYVLNEDNFKEKEKFKLANKNLEYPSHIIKDKNLVFKQVYELKPSVSGPKFKTWQPIVRLFKGFTSKNN